MRVWILALVLCTAAGGCAGRGIVADPPMDPAPYRDNSPPPPRFEGPLDVRKSVERAILHAPALRTARARADAAAAGMDLADTAFLPRVDFIWQELRATRNNISGTT